MNQTTDDLPAGAKSLLEAFTEHDQDCQEYILGTYAPDTEQVNLSLQMRQGQVIDLIETALVEVNSAARALLIHRLMLDPGTAMAFAAGIASLLGAEGTAPAPVPGNTPDNPQ